VNVTPAMMQTDVNRNAVQMTDVGWRIEMDRMKK
jgi:hypothetical protein